MAMKILKRFALVSLLITIPLISFCDNKQKKNKDQSTENKIDTVKCRILVSEGDSLALLKLYGEASSKYEQAIYFNPKSQNAYLRYAKVYSEINPNVAIETLQKLLVVDSTATIAEKEIAELYYGMGDISNAALYYSKYVESSKPSSDDIARYSTILFSNKDYAKSLQYVKQYLEKDTNHFVLRRLRMYNEFELKDTNVNSSAEKFMNETDTSKYIHYDYVYYAKVLKNKKEYEKSNKNIEKALVLDSTATDLYRTMGENYQSLNNYDKAIENYLILLEKGRVTLGDYQVLGQTYYFAGTNITSQQDSLKRVSYLLKADSMFSVVAEKAPSKPLGNFWRARANSAIDQETTLGLAKPYYEAALALYEQDNKDTKKIIECYSYLGYYYFVKNEMAKSKEYWNKILAIDPSNDTAIKALKGIK